MEIKWEFLWEFLWYTWASTIMWVCCCSPVNWLSGICPELLKSSLSPLTIPVNTAAAVSPHNTLYLYTLFVWCLFILLYYFLSLHKLKLRWRCQLTSCFSSHRETKLKSVLFVSQKRCLPTFPFSHFIRLLFFFQRSEPFFVNGFQNSTKETDSVCIMGSMSKTNSSWFTFTLHTKFSKTCPHLFSFHRRLVQ